MRPIQHSKRKRIIVLVFYFGELPWYFCYFLHTCRYNPSVDFLFITDSVTPVSLPKNVKIFKISLEKVKKVASEKLGYDVSVDPKPYKFCDFRPAFGVIFHEYIKDYTFWGHGDLDVIFGNIRNFITDELLNQYDIICSRHDYVSSWFTLYRNCEKINRLFMNSHDHRKVFTTPKYYNFDETNFTFREFSHGIPYYHIPSEIESMTHLIKKLNDEKAIKAYFDLHAIEGLTGNLKWDRGRLIYKNSYEIMLYHLLKFKKVFKPKRVPNNIPDNFHISRNQIHF